MNFGVDEVLDVAEICGSECPRQERMKLRLDEEGQFVPLSIDDSLHMPENAWLYAPLIIHQRFHLFFPNLSGLSARICCM